jgi:hypothetical protein
MSQEVEQNKAAFSTLCASWPRRNSRLGAIENRAEEHCRPAVAHRRAPPVVDGEIETLAGARDDAQKARRVAREIAQQRSSKRSAPTPQQLGKQIASVSENLGAAKEHRSGLISRRSC